MPTPEEYRRIESGPQSPQEYVWWDKYSHENLEPWRKICDEKADTCTAKIKRGTPAQMLDEVISRASSEGGAFNAFLSHCYTVPDWVDFEELEKGRALFRRYAGFQGIILLCSSLVEGYTLYKPSQVLISTGRLQHDVTKRIYETGQMLHNIVGDDGVRPGSVGHRTCMEVRLLHSAVRQFLWKSDKWDSTVLDEPINQEDMAATVLGFDFMLTRGLKKLGVELSTEEHAAMHYYWRYVGYLLGVDESLLTTTPKEQEVFALQVTTHLYRPTEGGESLVKALLASMSHKPPFYLSEDFLLAMAAHLGGVDLERDFHLQYSRRSAIKVKALAQLGRLYNLGEKRLPKPVLTLYGSVLHRFRRRSIVTGLGGDDVRYAFKGIA
ncbi:hypothetical protein A9Q99_19475 [Gammaproteobacteria bacterium 45_16_T64]|nr:hypothetical protein A9Q99_19475 [Gammaproteobacteria bacterium 45_16_T64]